MLIAVCTHACTVVSSRLDIKMYVHHCNMAVAASPHMHCTRSTHKQGFACNSVHEHNVCIHACLAATHCHECCLLHHRSITDMQPRDLDAQGQSLLTRFAGMAVRQLEQASLAKSLAHQAYIEGHAAALCNATRGSADPAMLCDISNQQHWRILAVNPAWVAASGICRSVSFVSGCVLACSTCGYQDTALKCSAESMQTSTISCHLQQS